MSSPQLTFYGFKVSANAMRVAIALSHAKADFTFCSIDLMNKPEWFVSQVNPAGKVPAVTIGGPIVPPDQPSPESAKIAESLVILELVADLYPSSRLMPSDPVERAKVRFFMQTQQTVFANNYFPWYALGKANGWKDLYEGAKALQALLPENGTGYAVGNQLTIADCAFAPLWGRTKVCFERCIGRFDPEEAKLFKEAMEAPEMAKFRAYTDRLFAHPSVKEHWDEEFIATASKGLVAVFEKRFGPKP
ncbi:glutathione S-transferase C-terminal-like protein [Coniophora puteana RWD-64-598 SS2]|uniref:Glutathione S-transferase C-terminal-like protein n=1 Tax=Coniophora puteana (strain RWD-64-598) TaxID=741705 RepID=A0A5M3MF94_CONPW|nr:glutathione S-transferase C-terminal-like protein [Coniophora puteana RWD-64-598 SS2]EIW77600.1 glutathione S-transferase C-terminal-like protein [Coniophora puteana RWD-64-598 SS2]